MTPADFPFFSNCTAASTSLRRMGWSSECLSGDSSVLMDLHWPCDCTAQSRILSRFSISRSSVRQIIENCCSFASNTQIAIVIIIIIINPLTARVVGAPQMISQPVSSIFPCSPLPSGTGRAPRPVHSLMLSSHLFFAICLVLFRPFNASCKAAFQHCITLTFFVSLSLFNLQTMFQVQ